MIKAKIPNLLSCLRIILSVIILTVSAKGLPFYVLFFASALSDIADGFLARHFKTQSKLGARLDSIADFSLIAAVLIKLLPLYPPNALEIVWICAIFAVKVISVLIGFVRFSLLYMPHTILNKLTGISLFVLVFIIGKAQNAPIIAVCALASLAAMEELLITTTAKDPNANRKSLFTH